MAITCPSAIFWAIGWPSPARWSSTISAWGWSLGTHAGENAFRQALEPPTQGLAPGEEDGEDVSRVRARALRALGQQPQAKPLPQSPREVLQLAERVMTAPCRQGCLSQPLALVLEYAETIVPAVDLGSMGEPDRAALVTLLRWARQRELVEAGHVIILTTGNLAELNPNLLLSRHGAQIIEVPPPDQAARLHFIEHLLASGACQLELSSQGLANLAAGLSLQVVRSLLQPVPARPPHHGDGAQEEEGPAAPGVGGAHRSHRTPVRPGGNRRVGTHQGVFLPDCPGHSRRGRQTGAPGHHHDGAAGRGQDRPGGSPGPGHRLQFRQAA